MILSRMVQVVLVGAAVVCVVRMLKAARRGSFLVVFMTARLMMLLHGSDIPLYEAAQLHCPVNPYLMTPEVR